MINGTASSVTRRTFIRGLGLAGVAAAGGVLAACSPAPPAASRAANPTAEKSAQPTASGAPTTAAAATPVSAPGAAADGPTLRVTELQEVNIFDPALISSQELGLLVNNIYEGLVAHERDTTRLVPKLAEKWELSQDASTLKFTLRQGVKFHDGSLLDAAAVKFSFDRLKTINKGPATFLQGISQVDVIDPRTVSFSIAKNPRLALRALPLFMIVSPTALNANGKDDLGQKWIQQHSAGTGPYMLSEIRPQEKQTLLRFPDYWRGWAGGPRPARVESLVQLDQAAARLQIEKGDVDLTGFFNPDYAAALKSNPNIDVSIKRLPGPQYLMMNTKLKPLDDVRVRQAISHAWNRAAWAEANPDAVLGEQIAPAPLEVLGEDYKPAVTYEYDLDKARKLLADAGHPGGGFKFPYYYLAGDDEKKRIGELLSQDLSQLGIQMEVRSFTAARMFEMVKDYGETQNPASAIGMTVIFTPARFFDAHNWLDWHFNSEAWKYGRNFMYYANPQIDGLLAKAAGVLTDEEARPMYRQISDLVVKDAPMIMVATQVGKMAVRKNIEGFYFNLQMYPTTVTFYDLFKK